jgi:hypothetical protein
MSSTGTSTIYRHVPFYIGCEFGVYRAALCGVASFLYRPALANDTVSRKKKNQSFLSATKNAVSAAV